MDDDASKHSESMVGSTAHPDGRLDGQLATTTVPIMPASFVAWIEQ